MNADDARLRALIKAAPSSIGGLFSLLYEGLDWPIYDMALEADDILLDWAPEELQLDPEHVARLTGISQIPPLTAKQKFGAFYLRFEGGQLPIGAVRRLVQQLVTSKRGKGGGKLPTWKLSDLLFFCHADGSQPVLHVVNFQEREGKRVLRVLTWNDQPTETRLSLLARRALDELRWTSDEGPRVVTDPSAGVGFSGYREGIKSAKALSRRMAEVALDVRDEVNGLLTVETADGPMRSLYRNVQEKLIGDITPERFADVYAQTMVYGLLTARIAHPEDFKAEQSLSVIKFDNHFLDAIYSRFRDETDEVIDVDELGLADLADQLANTDVDELLADFGADNQRDDPVVYFYEEFLAQYDPQQRKDLGAFYTPKPVVRYIVKTVDDALKSFGLTLGVADSTTWRQYVAGHPDIEMPAGVNPDDAVVSMFDPANGTGTFLVEWLEQAKRNAGQAGADAALKHASAVEISLASYAVSHLKVSLDLSEGARQKARLPIYLGDTLGMRRPEGLKGIDDPIGDEGRLADRVKYDRHHNVLIGNPPYDRVESEGTGGFITARTRGTQAEGFRSLFDDIFDDARRHVIFSAHASLYNLYVYFWRWGIWKVFEQNTGPAVMSMITASSWLDGAGFLGLRRLAREVADEIIVLDLHGDGLGARKDANVFDIQSPVAIVTLTRRGRGDRSRPASVRYASLFGKSRDEKLSILSELAAGRARLHTMLTSDDWHSPFIPVTGGADWASFPKLTDLFPWQQPGAMISRTWPVAPDVRTLKRRWSAFTQTGVPDERLTAFSPSKTGRTITTKVAGMAKLMDLAAGDAHEPIVRFGMRSFDRQWTFEDPRLAKTESPSLWASLSKEQVFLTTMTTTSLGDGPAATLTTAVPDKHFFSGRGGKDIIPLYRDAKKTPNADPKLLAALTARHRAVEPSAAAVTLERLFAYAFGVLAGADYRARFADGLETPGPRVPVTSDPGLFERMVAHGKQLVWLQTFGERFGEGAISTAGIEWSMEPTRLPDGKTDLAYDSATQTLRVADGALVGVPADVWRFSVSGMEVIPKWLGYRMVKPAGRAASSDSPLDHIRPTAWATEWSDELIEIVAAIRETLAELPDGIALLDEIVAGPLISAEELPAPPAALRQPPKTNGGDHSGLFADDFS
ncbi:MULTISPECIES: type ISP restriction/modification enzyme [unclassified Microbacterium]|uniref:type ISP restriction/modification enzyme n=1 Tax=unclassified Microbacterium TaxID=2609290 RepID=UPI003C2D5944